ncbi:MAG: tetratricopeptide repeat protein [Candidatus Eisenbacteria bacterium]
MTGRRRVSRRKILLALYAAAFVLRLFYLWESGDNPFQSEDNLGLDARYYDKRAMEILDEGLIGDEPYFMGPLYPHLLAAVYGLGGRNILLVRILQAAIAAFVPVLLYRIGSRVFTPTAALVAAAAAAFYGPFIFYAAALLYTTVAVTLLLWILDRLTAVPGARPGLHRFLTGLLLGLAVIGKGNVVLFLPFALLGLAWGTEVKIRWRLAPPAFALAGLLVVIGAVTARNYASGGEVVLVTTNGGLNFYIGNGPESDGGYRRPKGLDVYTDPAGRRLLEKELGREVTPAGASRIWLDRSFRWIAENPGREADLLLRKLVFTFSNFEIPQIEIYPVEMAYSRLLTIFHIPFGLIVALGLGATVFLRTRRTFLPVSFLYVYAFSLVLFFVVTRFRLPFVPLLLLFAAWLLSKIVEEARRGRWRTVLVHAGATLPFFVLSNMNFFHVAPTLGVAESHFRLGLIAEREGRIEEAEGEYRRSAEGDPNHALTRVNLGALLARRGRMEEAEHFFREAIAIDPDYPKAYLNLGTLLYRQGRTEEGKGALERAVALDREYGKAWLHLAALALLDGTGDGEAKARRALAALPEGDSNRAVAAEAAARARELENLGRWRLVRGESAPLPEAARRAVVAELLQDRPDADGLYRTAEEGGDPAAILIYGLSLLRAGRLEEARARFERVEAADPGAPYVQFGLGAIAQSGGRPAEAMERFIRETGTQPGFAPAWRGAALLAARSGNGAEARRCAEGYLRSGGPEDPAIRALLGGAGGGR